MEKESERTPALHNILVTGSTVYDIQTPLKADGLPEAPTGRIVFRDIYVNDAKGECLFHGCKDLVINSVYVSGERIKYEK